MLPARRDDVLRGMPDGGCAAEPPRCKMHPERTTWTQAHREAVSHVTEWSTTGRAMTPQPV
jgi:hypothetical protein